MFFPLNPSASMRSWHGILQSNVMRPLESVWPSNPPDASLTDAPGSAAPEPSSTVRVKGARARALSAAGRTTIPATMSAPNSALDRNDRIRLTWGPFEGRLEQLADGRWRIRRLTSGCEFPQRDQHK